MDWSTFRSNWAPGRVIPVSRTHLADTQTPVSAFLRLREGARSAFLLESVEGGERVGRWSFLGRDPYLVLRGYSDRVECVSARGKDLREADFFSVLRGEVHAVTPVVADGLPPFSGGAVGYAAYDAIRLIAFELGLRFFTDYLEGDVYFKVKHRQNNLWRALVQFKLTESIESQETEVRATIARLTHGT